MEQRGQLEHRQRARHRRQRQQRGGGFNYDDVAGLALGALTQSEDASTTVVAPSLSVGTVTSTGFLVADAFLAGAPVTVTVGTISEDGGVNNADGAGAVLVSQSTVDPGELYVADTGGLVSSRRRRPAVRRWTMPARPAP